MWKILTPESQLHLEELLSTNRKSQILQKVSPANPNLRVQGVLQKNTLKSAVLQKHTNPDTVSCKIPNSILFRATAVNSVFYYF